MSKHSISKQLQLQGCEHQKATTPKSPLKKYSYASNPSHDWTRVDSTDTNWNAGEDQGQNGTENKWQ